MSKVQTARQRNQSVQESPIPNNISLIPNMASVKDLPPMEEVLTGVNIMLKAKYGITIEEAPKEVQDVEARIQIYKKRMAPNVAISDPSEGALNQIHFINTILRSLKIKEVNDMFMAVDVVLWHIHTEREGLFSDAKVYRFHTSFNKSVDEVEMYSKLIEIFLRISNPINRGKVARSGDINAALTTLKHSYLQSVVAIITYLNQYK